MRNLNIGLIGCGVMGTSLARAFLNTENTKLAVVCDAVKDAARKLGKELGVPASSDLGAVLGRKRLDGVLVATPPFLHRKVCLAAARAGKHVFVEKPLAPSVKECDSIIRAAKRARIKLMVGQVCRYHPIHRKVRDLVCEGAIGEVAFMEVHRLGGGWGGIWDKSWRQKRKMSGGALMEINAHEIDFMRFVCGDARTVYAAGGNYRNPRQDYADVAAVTVKFESGATGFLHSSQASAIGGYGGRVDGTGGTLHFPSFGGEGAGIHYKKWDSPTEFIPAADLPSVSPVQAEIEDWLEAIRQDTDPPIPGEVGRAAVQIAEAAYESIETGKPVRLG